MLTNWLKSFKFKTVRKIENSCNIIILILTHFLVVKRIILRKKDNNFLENQNNYLSLLNDWSVNWNCGLNLGNSGIPYVVIMSVIPQTAINPYNAAFYILIIKDFNTFLNFSNTYTCYILSSLIIMRIHNNI